MTTIATSVTVVDGPLADAAALDARVDDLRRRFPRAIIDRYLATLPYWLGRAQAGVGLTRNAADNFKQFLARRSDAPRDPLAADASRRLASLAP